MALIIIVICVAFLVAVACVSAEVSPYSFPDKDGL